MSVAAFLKEALTGPGAVTRLAGAALLVTTLAAQHPNPAFERAREKDLFSLVPNWKFFAPNPRRTTTTTSTAPSTKAMRRPHGSNST